MFNRDKVQFQDLWSERIFLGQATKLYNFKSQSSEVVSVFRFCLFQWMPFYLAWIYRKGHCTKFFFDSLHFCLTFLHHISKNWKPLIFLRISTGLGGTHLAKIKINQNCKIRLQILDIWCKNVRQKCRESKKKFCKMSFSVNPG